MTSRPWSRLYNPTKRCTLRNIWEWEPFLVTVMLLLIDMHHNNWNMIALSPSKTCVSEWNVVSNLTVWQNCAIVQYGTLSSPLSSGVSLSGKLGQWFTTDPTSSSLDPAHEKKWWDSQTSANERPGMCSMWPMSFDDVCVTIYPSYWVPGVIHVNFPPLATQLRGLLWPDPLISALSCPHPLCTGAQANQAPGWQETQNQG